MSKIGEQAGERIASGDYSGQAKSAEDYLKEAILKPDEYVPADCPSGPCSKGVMPATLGESITQDELASVVTFLAGLPGNASQENSSEGNESEEVAEAAVQPVGNAPTLSEEDFAWAKQTFFDRCAGCHGTLRNGATGPALTPDKTIPKGTVGLAAIIFNGTPKGMPDWGKHGLFNPGTN